MVTGLMTKAEKVVVARALFLAFLPPPLILSFFYLVLFKKKRTQSKIKLISSGFILQATGEQGKFLRFFSYANFGNYCFFFFLMYLFGCTES